MEKLHNHFASKNTRLIYILLPIFFLSLTLFNHAYRISESSDHFVGEQTIPIEHPGGVDYRYVYKQTVALKQGINAYLKIHYLYPPLTAVANLPLSLFDENNAYKLFTYLSLLSLFFSIYLALKENIPADQNTLLVFLSVTVFTIAYNTYPVMFAIERGNSDSIAALFSMGTLYAVTRRKMLLSIILLTVATNYKVYPLILFAIIFLRFGRKTIPLIILTNTAAFFVLGYKGFYYFIQELFFSHAHSHAVWEGNHSLYSFLNQTNILTNTHIAFYLISLSLISVFILAWLASLTKFSNRSMKTFSVTEVGLIGIAFQLMVLLPPISHDYNLLILFIPYILFLTREIDDFKMNPNNLLMIGMLLSTSMGFIFALRYSIIGVNTAAYPFLIPLKTLAILLNYLLFTTITIDSILKENSSKSFANTLTTAHT